MEGKKDYRDCPQRCPKDNKKRYDVFRDDYCKVCPKRTDLDRLKRKVEEVWVEWLGDKLGERQKFHKVFRTLSQIQTIRRSDNLDDHPVRVATLLQVYAIEESWFKDKDK